ncbi:MAG: hypothetical protein V1726_01970 [Methanobacteriota archaeon]
MKPVIRPIITFCFVILLFISMYSVAAEDHVTVVLYYSATCGSCKIAKKLIDDLKMNYSETQVVFIEKQIGVKHPENQTEWESYRFHTYPGVVINNETLIPKENITQEKLVPIIDAYIVNLTVEPSNNQLTLLIMVIGIVCIIGILLAVVRRQRKQKK